jgi:hypothetical protein
VSDQRHFVALLYTLSRDTTAFLLSLKFRTKFWGIKTLKKERKVAY